MECTGICFTQRQLTAEREKHFLLNRSNSYIAWQSPFSERNTNLFVDTHQYVLHVVSASLENQIKSHITKCFESHRGKKMGNVQWSSCHIPNIYITLKSMCLNPNLQCDNIRRWSFGSKSRSWR